MTVVSIEESSISLHSMKKMEIIVSGEHESFVSHLMDEAHVSGFTLIRNVSGKGHSGFHEGKLMFNDKSVLVMFIAVAPEPVIATIAVGMKTLFQKSSGVMFVSDVSVARLDYFME
jgi:nitrogen regulatory protein PII